MAGASMHFVFQNAHFYIFFTMIPKGYQTPHIMIKKLKRKKLFPFYAMQCPQAKMFPKQGAPDWPHKHTAM
jgi:hypothetical protein